MLRDLFSNSFELLVNILAALTLIGLICMAAVGGFQGFVAAIGGFVVFTLTFGIIFIILEMRNLLREIRDRLPEK